ncbi:MAG: hypothetical protein KatS3mg094_078 [Candidatus Parcubacteria bacterium]|nr:MAG: hypothetical protein KatS3mg094_078 [Candidatus Parcubacteria bacterium]
MNRKIKIYKNKKQAKGRILFFQIKKYENTYNLLKLMKKIHFS